MENARLSPQCSNHAGGSQIKAFLLLQPGNAASQAQQAVGEFAQMRPLEEPTRATRAIGDLVVVSMSRCGIPME